MSGGGLVEVLAAHTRLTWAEQPFACTCDPQTSDMTTTHAAHLADVVTAHLAARLEGCREEVLCAIEKHTNNRLSLSQEEAVADVGLAIVRDALGLEPPSDALGGAVDGRTGGSGTSMQGERAGDGG